MSDYGPRIEATDFDFRGYYGDESDVVYTDSGLRKLVYEESPAYEITASDLPEYVGRFVEDEITDRIFRRVNNDATTTEAIRCLEDAQLESAMKAFAIMDKHPDTQCTLNELAKKITARENYLETLDLRQDHAEVIEVKSQLKRFRLIHRDRERRIRSFDTYFRNVNRQRNDWPLKMAIDGIVRHKATQQERTETSTTME